MTASTQWIRDKVAEAEADILHDGRENAMVRGMALILAELRFIYSALESIDDTTRNMTCSHS